MKHFSILIIVLTFLWSCTNHKEHSTINDFEKYVSTLDQIPLPLKHNPLGQLPELSKDYNKNDFKKFKHIWTSQPLGIFYRDDKTIGIIDCSVGDWGLVPFLTTYDLKGNKIDSTGFYDKSGQDLGYNAIEHLTFAENRIIIVVDTVKRWDINENKSDITEGSMKMTTGKVVYRILENGRIEKK
jgi:hypothetical protein